MDKTMYLVTQTASEFPYSDKTTYVFRRSTPSAGTFYVRLVSGDTAGFVRSLKQESGGDIWLVGGGQISLHAGLIDEMVLTALSSGTW